jgi:hypothetical protein
MLLDRKIDFSDSKEEEWNQMRVKVGDGIELPLPDTERWFLATLDGERIRIESANKNVRPLKLYEPAFITFDEFKAIAGIYNDCLIPSVDSLSPKLEMQKSITNFKYVFMLIYHLV